MCTLDDFVLVILDAVSIVTYTNNMQIYIASLHHVHSVRAWQALVDNTL